MTRVLAVDDEPSMLRGLAVNLRARGYEVDTAPTGEAALELAALHPPNVVLLDLGLPGITGFDVIADLRSWTDTPIIVLSALSDQADKVHALDAGADDYVTKPFGMEELLARLRAAVRGTPTIAAEQVIRTDDFTLDFGAKSVHSVHGDVRLTPTEWRIVEVLVARAGQLVTNTHLLQSVWGPRSRDKDNTLRVHLGRIRQKLEPVPSRPRYFLTEIGLGYRFQAPEI